MLIRFLWVGMYPTVAAGGATPTQGYEIMGFMQAWIRVASQPPVVNTVSRSANVFPAAHTPILVTLQDCGAGFWSRLFTHDGYYW